MPFTPPTTVASQANTGYQAIFQTGSGSPVTYTSISEIKTFKANYFSIPEVERTHLLSPNNTEELTPGMLKPGTIDFTGNFLGDSSQLNITTLAQAQTVFPFKIVAPVQNLGKTYTATGNGFITKYEVGEFVKNKPVEFTATIQMTGPVTESVA